MKIPFTHYNTKEIEVSDEELKAIDAGLEDLKKGNVIPHNEAKKIFHNAVYNVDK